ncbi:MAG: hypothetical protein EOM20_12720 [Spartobacteria bacterium]|nr:hypothetical protein [Spartobacteria bacterium]
MVYSARETISRVTHRGFLFVALWWLVTFLLLTLVPNKQTQYVVLLLPPSALLIGIFMARAFSPRITLSSRFILAYLKTLVLLLGLVGGLGILVYPLFDADARTLPGFIISPLLLLLACISWRKGCTETPHKALAVCLAMLILINITYVYAFHPIKRTKSMLPRFIAQVHPYLDNAPTVYAIGYGIQSLEFYAGRSLTEEEDIQTTWQKMNPGDAVILSLRKDKNLTTDMIPIVPTRSTTWRGAKCLLFIKP